MQLKNLPQLFISFGTLLQTKSLRGIDFNFRVFAIVEKYLQKLFAIIFFSHVSSPFISKDIFLIGDEETFVG